MAITDWPMEDRPREKLLLKGAAVLSDAELLAIFLRTGIPGKTAVDLARDLLAKQGGLRQLLELSQQEFCQNPGLGQAKYAQLQAVLEIGRRHLYQEIERDIELTSPKRLSDYLKARLRHLPHEVFCCLYLDNQHRLISCENLFTGTIDGASIHTREVVKRVLDINAAAVIFAHNHPSGIAEPSQADRQITERLVKALALVDVRVLDHMIVGDSEVTSFAERGLL